METAAGPTRRRLRGDVGANWNRIKVASVIESDPSASCQCLCLLVRRGRGVEVALLESTRVAKAGYLLSRANGELSKARDCAPQNAVLRAADFAVARLRSLSFCIMHVHHLLFARAMLLAAFVYAPTSQVMTFDSWNSIMDGWEGQSCPDANICAPWLARQLSSARVRRRYTLGLCVGCSQHGSFLSRCMSSKCTGACPQHLLSHITTSSSFNKEERSRAAGALLRGRVCWLILDAGIRRAPLDSFSIYSISPCCALFTVLRFR
eukprot:5097127-Pleurochrysis_carterae.AAC.2